MNCDSAGYFSKKGKSAFSLLHSIISRERVSSHIYDSTLQFSVYNRLTKEIIDGVAKKRNDNIHHEERKCVLFWIWNIGFINRQVGFSFYYLSKDIIVICFSSSSFVKKEKKKEILFCFPRHFRKVTKWPRSSAIIPAIPNFFFFFYTLSRIWFSVTFSKQLLIFET